MSSTRAPRADAQRNRQRVLDVAAQAFAAEGKSAGLLDIAARAGVGAGTVYRHFPTKEALYSAVISARLTELLDRVPDLPDDPPGTRVVEFWRLACSRYARTSPYANFSPPPASISTSTRTSDSATSPPSANSSTEHATPSDSAKT